MTHINLHTSVCVLTRAFCPRSCPVHMEAARGMDVLSSPCLSSSHLRSCCLVTQARKHILAFSLLAFLSIYLSDAIYFTAVCSFIASLIHSVSICSLLILLISLRLSFSLRKSAADLLAQKRDSCPQHFPSLHLMLVLSFSLSA